MKLLHEIHCERIVGGAPVGDITVSPTTSVDPVLTTEVKPRVVVKNKLIGQFNVSTQNIANAGVNTALAATQTSIQSNTVPV